MSSFIIAFSMYSKIPMPKVEWTKKNMRYALCFFPFVGILIGSIEYLFAVCLLYLKVPQLVIGAVLTLIPILITGGIHIDGFLDTIDAISSCKSKEEKLKILDDPHVGSFAVIYGCLYLILFFTFTSALSRRTAGFMAYVFIISRILSGISVLSFPKAKEGLVKTFSDNADRNVFKSLIVELIAAIIASVYFLGPVFLIPTAVAVFCFYLYFVISKRTFGGTSGDQAGAFVCITELVMLVVLFVLDFSGVIQNLKLNLI